MSMDLTVDEAVDAIGKIYWNDLYKAVESKDVDAIYDAAITLKALQTTRATMKEKFGEG